jgi:hypothetical protein
LTSLDSGNWTPSSPQLVVERPARPNYSQMTLGDLLGLIETAAKDFSKEGDPYGTLVPALDEHLNAFCLKMALADPQQVRGGDTVPQPITYLDHGRLFNIGVKPGCSQAPVCDSEYHSGLREITKNYPEIFAHFGREVMEAKVMDARAVVARIDSGK